MAEADKELRLGVGLFADDKSVAQTAKAMSGQLRKQFDRVAGKELSSGFEKSLAAAAKLEAISQRLTKNLAQSAQDLEDASKRLVSARDASAAAEAQVDFLKDNYYKNVEDGTLQGQDIQREKEKIAQAEKEAAQLDAKYQEVRADVERITKEHDALLFKLNDNLNQQAVINSKLDEQYDKLVKTTQQQEALNTAKREGATVSGTTSTPGEEKISTPAISPAVAKSVDNVQTALKATAEESVDATQKLQGFGAYIGGPFSAIISKIGLLLKTGLIVGLKLAKEGVQNLLLSFIRLTKQIAVAPFKKLRDILLGIKGAGDRAGISLRQLIMAGLGVRGLFALFSKLRSAISFGINNLLQYGNANNYAISAIRNLQASLTYLKNSWGAAFAPIIAAVGPYLQKLIDWCVKAANAVGALFAALTGHGTIIKAVRGVSSVGGAAGGTAKKLKDVADNAKKATDRLAGFDDLDVLGKDDDDTVLDDLADDLGGGGGGGLDTEDLFEEVEIPDWIKDFVDKLKEAWESGTDAMYELFYDLGRLVGEALLDALTTLNGMWPAIQEAARKIAAAIAGFINGFFETPGLAQALGTAIAGVINTAIAFVEEFIDRVHLYSIGYFIGETLSTALSEFDWPSLAHIIATGINQIFDFLQGLIDGVGEWQPIVKKITDGLAQLFTEINWSENGEKFNTFLQNLFGFLHDLIVNFPIDELAAGIAEFLSKIDWLSLFVTVLETAWSIFTDVWDLFLGLLRGLFPSARAEAALGLTDAFTDAGVEEFNKTDVPDAAHRNAQGTFEAYAQGMQEANTGELVQTNLLNPVMEKMQSTEVQEAAKESGRQIGNAIPEGINAAVEEGATIEAADNVVNSMTDQVLVDLPLAKETIMAQLMADTEEMLSTWWTEAVLAWVNVEKLQTDIITPIDTAIKTAWTTFLTWWRTTMTNWWKVDVQTWFLKDKWVAEFTHVYEAAVEVFTKVQQVIKEQIELARDAVIEACNAMKEAIASVIEAINELNEAIASIGGGVNFSFSASIPGLAEGAVIPPNNQFLAVLGDQTSGTNIEAPLDTIVDAFREVVGNMEVQNSGYAEMELDGEVFARLITPYVVSELNRQGYNVEVLEA